MLSSGRDATFAIMNVAEVAGTGVCTKMGLSVRHALRKVSLLNYLLLMDSWRGKVVAFRCVPIGDSILSWH